LKNCLFSRWGSACLPALVTALLACGTTDPAVVVDPSCIDVVGQGSTVGTMRGLMGSATFMFGDVERDAEVGIYLNDIAENGDGSLDLTIIYQFFWSNIDFILTQDPVQLVPMLEKDRYSFSVAMTVTSGGGMFEDQVGHRPFGLDATIQFGPPPGPGELKTAVEEFRLGGKVCEG